MNVLKHLTPEDYAATVESTKKSWAFPESSAKDVMTQILRQGGISRPRFPFDTHLLDRCTRKRCPDGKKRQPGLAACGATAWPEQSRQRSGRRGSGRGLEGTGPLLGAAQERGRPAAVARRGSGDPFA
jgi:hypothetical protein